MSIIRTRTIRFTPDRAADLRKIKLGFEGDNMVERLEFVLPEIADEQTATLNLGGTYANMVLLELSDNGRYAVNLTKEIIGTDGEVEAYIRIDGAGGEVWQSGVMRLVTGAVPDVETEIETRFPTAVETMLTEIAGHRADMAQTLTEAEEAAQRAEEAADRAQTGGGSGILIETDPTVPAWAKQPEKPKYTPEEIGAQPKGDYATKSELEDSIANISYNALTDKPFYENPDAVVYPLTEATDIQDGQIVLAAAPELIEGNEYRVIWNGVEYICTCEVFEQEGIAMLMLQSEAFAMLVLPDQLAEAMGGRFGVAALDESTDVSFEIRGHELKKLDRKFYDMTTWDGLKNQPIERFAVVLETTLDATEFSAVVQGSLQLPVELGKTYRVAFDGVVRDSVAVEASGNYTDWLDVDVMLGNPHLIDHSREDNGEDFAVLVNSSGKLMAAPNGMIISGIAITPVESGPCTLSVKTADYSGKLLYVNDDGMLVPMDVGDGLEVDEDGRISAKAQSDVQTPVKWEHINTVTLSADDVATVQLDKDADGNPLELEAFYIHMLVGAVDGVNSKLCVRVNDNYSFGTASIGLQTTLRSGYLDYVTDKYGIGMVRSMGTLAGTVAYPNSSVHQTYISLTPVDKVDSSVNKIRLYLNSGTTNLWKAGSTFELYGVRKHA